MKKILLTFILSFFLFPCISSSDIKPIIDGNVDAKVKIVVYESLTCGFCASFHKKIYPELKKEFIDKGFVSIEYKNFPLDIAAFNAAIYKGKFLYSIETKPLSINSFFNSG